MASHDAGKTLSGSHRSGVVGDDKGTVFIIGFDKKKEAKVPERFKNYSSKRKTAEEIAKSQRLAEERRKKHDENKVTQARKVSEEAIRYDKMVQARLGLSREPKHGGKWYSNAFKEK